MLQKIIEWFRTLWSDDVTDFVGDAYDCEYETLIKNKYGIADAWADTEEEDECKR